MRNLEHHIDAVARGMTAAEPHVDLRAAVMTRLEQRRRIPWFWIIGLTAAGMIALVIFAASREKPAAVAGQDVRTQPSASVPMGSVPMEPRTFRMEPRTFRSGDDPAADAARSRRDVSRPQPSSPQTRPMISEAERAWYSRSIPALEQPAPIVLDDIQPEPLEIRPLVTPAVIVPAIGEDESR